jgi:2-methylisocitrate lyase-like PEP mutase family enzyme
MAQHFEDSQHKSMYGTLEERKITALEEDFRSVTEARDVAKPQKYLVAKKDQE